jgi:hypothetical protein
LPGTSWEVSVTTAAAFDTIGGEPGWRNWQTLGT